MPNNTTAGKTNISVQTDGDFALMVFWQAGGNHGNHGKKGGIPAHRYSKKEISLLCISDCKLELPDYISQLASH